MQVSIELPNDFVTLQLLPDIQQEVSSSYALWLFQHERVTLVKAAELAGLDLYEFMALCKANQVPVMGISREDLLDELSGFNAA
jgi:predicted HTH domain antitoxin